MQALMEGSQWQPTKRRRAAQHARPAAPALPAAGPPAPLAVNGSCPPHALAVGQHGSVGIAAAPPAAAAAATCPVLPIALPAGRALGLLCIMCP